MKLPSLTYLALNAKQSLNRFPITIIAAFISVAVSIYMIEFEDDITDFFPYINVLLTSALGIPLFFSVSIISAKYNLNLKWRIGYVLGAFLFLTLIYFSLPTSNITHNTSLPYVRYGIFNIIIHLLVSFVPYINNHKINGFWNYNKTLFIRFWVSLLYSGFLYVGIILAITALKILFQIEIHDELYFELFVVIIGVFNTWFFVGGIPQNLDELENITTYPKGLKIFSQYVLLPLLILYMIILYAYSGKIVIEWEWPKGIVSYLIAWVSVLGILTILLIHPYGNLKENSWIKTLSNIFYPSLFPLIIVLFIAIWIRVDDYGVTINRYVIILLGVWLTLIAIFFTIRKSNIKFIPMSLAIILMLMSFGPWSMYSVSEKSQSERLKVILLDHELLTAGRINNEYKWEVDSLPSFISFNEPLNDNLINDSIHNEIKSILDYLDDHHGFSSIQPLFEQNVDSLISIAADSNTRINEARIYMQSMGFKYQFRSNTNRKEFSFSSKKNKILNVGNYDYLYSFDQYSKNSTNNKAQINNIWYTNKGVSKEDQTFVLRSQYDSIVFDLEPMAIALIGEYGESWESNIAPDKMTISSQSNMFDCLLEISKIRFNNDSNQVFIAYIEGDLLLKNKSD